MHLWLYYNTPKTRVITKVQTKKDSYYFQGFEFGQTDTLNNAAEVYGSRKDDSVEKKTNSVLCDIEFSCFVNYIYLAFMYLVVYATFIKPGCKTQRPKGICAKQAGLLLTFKE